MVPRITFYSVVRGAAHPTPAQKSALGSMPMAPYQYCEALRAASGHGWYAFPLEDLIVRFDGHSVEVWEDGEWTEFDTIELSDKDTEEYRRQSNCEPPAVYSSLFVPGTIQLWTGLLVTSAPGWSMHVGPIVNVTHHHGYQTYAGIVETDEFKPCPLFINLRLIETGRDIMFSKQKPLFQVHAVHRDSYTGERAPTVIEPKDMTPEIWAGVATTTRPADSKRPPGEYAKAVRKRLNT